LLLPLISVKKYDKAKMENMARLARVELATCPLGVVKA